MSHLNEVDKQLLSEVNSQPLIEPNELNLTLIANKCLSALSELRQQSLMASEADMIYTTPPPPLEPSTEKVDTDNALITEFYERFSSGTMFETLQALRSAVYDYGRKYNVALTTSKSDKAKVYLICKHGGHYRKTSKRKSDKEVKPRMRRSQKTGCECMIYARCCRNSFWIIRKSVGEHNHPIAEDPRTYAMYRSLSPENLLMVHKLLREHVGISFIVKSLRASGVTNIIAKDIENIQQDLKRRDVLLIDKEGQSKQEQQQEEH
ncbi:hypothetical protein BDB01DRAFT_855566 [Pilobolus umbonatus]|nr:hypothetical protein BDB01DRAFT_855566 [Pilobolus umbonatus]